MNRELDQGGCCDSGQHVLTEALSGKNPGKKLAGNNEQAMQFGRLDEPKEEPPEKL